MGSQVEFRRVRRRNRPQSLRADIPRPLSADPEPDVLLSGRRVCEEDVVMVAPLLGASWRLLGLRLNFDPVTLDHVQQSARGKLAEALYMLRLWSQLPTATIGRLATVLWEMGKHTIAMQLRP